MILIEPKKMGDDCKQINGLVLAGGKSSRMGHDKGSTIWYEKEQRYHLADLLSTVCKEVYISCRSDQQINSDYQKIVDTVTNAGPLGGLLSAFQLKKNTAWLVVACDLPLLDEKTLVQLILKRDETAMATAFESHFDGLPEPLIAIWEPKSLPFILEAVAQGKTCPRKILINNGPKIIRAENSDALLNANTPADEEMVKNILKERKEKMA